MIKAVSLALMLVPGLALAQPIPWGGSLAGRSVTRTTVPTVRLGNQFVVAQLGLFCRGTPRHAINLVVMSDDPRGLPVQRTRLRAGAAA